MNGVVRLYDAPRRVPVKRAQMHHTNNTANGAYVGSTYTHEQHNKVDSIVGSQAYFNKLGMMLKSYYNL